MPSHAFEISLKGEANVYLPAERAVLKIDVSTTNLDKPSASRDTVATARKVESLLKQLGPQQNTAEARKKAPIDYWSRTSLSENSRAPYDSETQTYRGTEYTANVDFEAQIQKFSAISGLITELSTLQHLEIRSLKWVLSEPTKDEHRSALRAASAKDAYQKALEYAQALGYKTVFPIILKEARVYDAPSNMKGGPIPTDGVTTTAKNLAEAEGWEEIGGGVFEYRPEDIKISAAIDATFNAA